MTLYDWLNSTEVIERSKRSYAHFDLRTDVKKQNSYISNPKKVSTHGFYPFIHYQIESLKFDNATKRKKREKKIRDICYAAHIDRCIYQYYSFLLNELYNERVQINGTQNVAVAYRTNFFKKTNISFSKQAFDFIKSLKSCFVMIGDFTHFFDNLEHEYLKKQWCSLLNCDRLPTDHYNVFKNITTYSTWELSDLLSLNNLSNDYSGRKRLNQKVRVLTPKQFKENKSHITKHIEPYGIPQGSPISGLLANVYMLEIDKLINDLVSNLGGLYMRYSDDFIIILPDHAELNIANTFKEIGALIDSAPRLILEPSKTQYFHYNHGILKNCGTIFDPKANDKNRFINFLGFTFNGQQVSIRAKTLSKYYYRMYRKAKSIAKVGGYVPSTGKHISCEVLYRKYSVHGSKEKHGNFITYVTRAQQEYGPNEPIERDTKRHMQKIRKALNSQKKNNTP